MARLFHAPLSPFCRKVRLSLAEKKIECELVEERYWEKDADFLRRNPAGKVPVLRMGERTMSESAAICEYLEEAYPEPALLPKGADKRYEVRRLVSWFDDKFHAEVTSNLLYERVNRKLHGTGYPISSNVKDGAKAIKYHLDYELAAGTSPLVGRRHNEPRGFRRSCASVFAGLYQRRGLEPLAIGQGLVRDDQVSSGLPVHSGRSRAGLPAPTPLR